MPELAPGLHPNIPMSDYLALPYLSSSVCHTLLTCSPFHAKWQMDNGRNDGDDNDASDMGTAIHDALLEGVDRIVGIDAPDWRTKAAKEAREEARAAGKIPMLNKHVGRIEAAVNSAKRYIEYSELKGLFDAGYPEGTMIWEEEGIRCKARPDWTNDEMGVICHLKTTKGTAAPESWIRGMLASCGYDISAALYERAARALDDGTGNYRSVFLVIEQMPPFGCSLIALDPAMQDIADGKVERAIATWRECWRKGRWPGYPTRIAYAAPTSWQMAEAEERALEFDARNGTYVQA